MLARFQIAMDYTRSMRELRGFDDLVLVKKLELTATE